MGQIGRKLPRQTIKTDIPAMQIFKNIPNIGQADGKMGRILPAATIIGAQRCPNQLHGYTESVVEGGG